MIRLYVSLLDGSPMERSFETDSVLIGRASHADLVLPDRSLSREHARIFRLGDSLMVEDMGSSNGTYLNGELLRQPSPLVAGDLLSLGAIRVALTREARGRAMVDATDADLGAHSILRPASEMLAGSDSSIAAQSPTDAAALRQLAERLQIFNEVHQALARSITLDELLELILDRTFDHLKPEQGAIFLKRANGEFHCAASRSVGGTADRLVVSRSLIREVADKRMAALVVDATADSRFREAESLMATGVRSLIAAPLLDGNDALGMIVLSSRVAVRHFSEADLELLVPLASVAALRIRNVALAVEAAERRRLEHEVALARRIQVALLPDELPEVPGYELYGDNIPSQGVSGDYYEVIWRLDRRECVVLVADVSGKGIGAAFLTASLEALSVAPIEDGLPPEEVFLRVSRLLLERTTTEKYATGFIAALEPETGSVRYCNAGHCPALVVRSDGTQEWLSLNGFPLGLLPDSTYTRGEAVLAVGDLLVIYTDGITEAADPNEDEYGPDRLAAVCTQHRSDSLKQVAAALESDLESFAQGVPFHDDRTLVILRRVT